MGDAPTCPYPSSDLAGHENPSRKRKATVKSAHGPLRYTVKKPAKEETMSARYVLKQEDKGQYRFTLITHSGQVLLTSDIYTDKDLAMRHISAARSFVRRGSHYEFLTS
jgi:uncharacterized protein YegP (UPF0339 family)